MELHRLTVLKHKTLMETQKILLSSRGVHNGPVSQTRAWYNMAEAGSALEQATNQAKMAEFSLMHKYMRSTDQKYLDFIASEASSPAPPGYHI
ncbi:hypothetical protein F2Q69_00024871 [Brassica cretica]|uniref:Uncharacterized protein n=1 Tax=Brassica cretica TaxID=69181 RepID=A0A8S9QDG8_BRACR|nr:hypothetical protein F2Q69_00024871 [Brassica cretica]